jgi:hypothetical protein
MAKRAVLIAGERVGRLVVVIVEVEDSGRFTWPGSRYGADL